VVAAHEGKVTAKKEELARKHDEVQVKVLYRDEEMTLTAQRKDRLSDLQAKAYGAFELEAQSIEAEECA